MRTLEPMPIGAEKWSAVELVGPDAAPRAPVATGSFWSRLWEALRQSLSAVCY